MFIGCLVDLFAEGLSIRNAKDKIYEHAAKMLTSEVRGILKSKSAISPVPTTSPSPEAVPRKPLKTILKKDSSPTWSNGHTKSDSSEDEGMSSEETSSKSDDLNKKTYKFSGKEEILRDEDFTNEKENLKKAVREDIETVNNKRNKDVLDNVRMKVDECVKEMDIKNRIRKHLEEVQQMSSSTEGTPQTSDGESSGGREVKRIIGNEAVARRRQAALNRQKEK